jgi:hypothetical protein
MYKNSILLEGFGDTRETEVSLYAVSRSEVASEPVNVTVKPLPPSIIGVRASLVLDSAFGGINVKFINVDSANIVFETLVKDSKGDWQHVDFYYTSMPKGEYNIRGFPPEEREWGVYVRDRWDNHTDTITAKIKPIYEEQLDKSKFKDVRVKQNDTTDVPQFTPLSVLEGRVRTAEDYSSSWVLSKLWDNSGMGTTGSSNGFHTKEKYNLPIWIPFDLGFKYVLSRYKIWQRTGTYIFNHGNPHHWEIWGTNNTKIKNSDPNNKNPDNGWVKLGEWVMVKPSGIPEVGVNSAEDIEVATNGQEYEFGNGLPAVRYIAWKNIDSWGSIDNYTGFMHLMEITLWGQKK